MGHGLAGAREESARLHDLALIGGCGGGGRYCGEWLPGEKHDLWGMGDGMVN